MDTKRSRRPHFRRPDLGHYAYERLPLADLVDFTCGWCPALEASTETPNPQYRTYPEYLACWQLVREAYFADEQRFGRFEVPYAEELLQACGPAGPQVRACHGCGRSYWDIPMNRDLDKVTCTACP